MSVQDNFAGGRYSPAIADFLRQTFNECDVAGDGVLLHDEALLCLQLLRTAEYATLSLLRGGAASPSLLAASPALLGVCGLMYAVQYAPSAPFLGYRTPLADTRSWSFRSRLAVALLDMVERLEETALGTLYLCDMQEDNFGVVRGAGGRLVAKAIDVDIAWFGPALQQEVTSGAELSRPCSADGDCAFARCQVACNHTTGFCSGQLASSNLQVSGSRAGHTPLTSPILCRPSAGSSSSVVPPGTRPCCAAPQPPSGKTSRRCSMTARTTPHLTCRAHYSNSCGLCWRGGWTSPGWLPTLQRPPSIRPATPTQHPTCHCWPVYT